MGCFDVACGLSGATIKHGDSALLLLIMPTTDYPESGRAARTVEIKPGVQQVFNEGPLGMYMPFCLPIRGEYNDYGSLENLVKDDTLKAFETFFGGSFEKLMEVIYNGEYSKLHDEEVLALYGNNLKIDRYSGKVDKKWLLSAGFTEKDNKYYHPEVTNIIKMGEDGKIQKTKEQKCYVTFKVPFQGSGKKEIVPHIIYWENDKWNEIWQDSQRDFCETFMEYSKPMGWFADDLGVVLGIKKECIQKAQLLRKLSGMFMDGKVYDALTTTVTTNKYYRQNYNGVRDIYMNKYLMDKIGFKFERLVDGKTKEVTTEDDMYGDSILLYSHKNAPDHLFGVRTHRSMATDMYKVKGDKLIEVKTYDGKRSYHPFSPDGLAKMFEGETGNKLDLSGLDNITPFDITLMRINDFFLSKEEAKKKRIEMEKEIKALDGVDKETHSKMLSKLFRLEDRSTSRDKSKEALGHFNFPYVTEFYSKLFMKPTIKFKDNCIRFTNLMTSLWGINKPLMPSSHFGQHGDYENQIIFNRLVANALTEKLFNGSSSEFDNAENMIKELHLLLDTDELETRIESPKRKKNEGQDRVIYSHKGTDVAAWEGEYGYLITKEGL